MHIPILSRIFGRSERAAADDPTFFLTQRTLAALGGAGTLNEQPMSQHPWLYRAIRVISDAILEAPITVQTGEGDTKRVVTTGPWHNLFENPNPEYTTRDTIALTVVNLMLDGEVFWVLDAGEITGSTSVPKQIDVRRGREFKPLVSSGGTLVGWEWTSGQGNSVKYALSEVVHFRLPNPYNPRRGLSPLSAAMQGIRTDYKAAQLNEAILDNGATPDGILTTDKAIADPQVKQIRSLWNARHRGSQNAGKVAILHSGLNFIKTGLDMKEMQYLEQREWSRQEVAAVYGVPLFLLTILGDVHRETSRESLKLFWQNTVVPIMKILEDSINTRLLLPRGGGKQTAAVSPSSTAVYVEWDLSGIAALQTEASERIGVAKEEWRMGVPFDVINARHNLGYEPVPGGDIGWVDGKLKRADGTDAIVKEEPREAEPIENDLDVEPTRAPVAPLIGVKRMRNKLTAWLRAVRKEVVRYADSHTQDQTAAWLNGRSSDWASKLLQKTEPVTTAVATEYVSGALDEILLRAAVRAQNEKKLKLAQNLIDALRDALGGPERPSDEILADLRLVFNAAGSRTLVIAQAEARAIAGGIHALTETYGIDQPEEGTP